MQVTADQRLIVPASPAIINLFPSFQGVDENRGLIPHDPYSTILLRNLGYTDVPSPVLYHYHFPHPPEKPPFDVQKDTVRLLTENQRAYVLSGMGVGKTVCALWAFDYLRRLGMAKKVLIVAPLSTLRFTWGREAFDFVPHLRVSVVYGTKAQRLAALAAEADIYIINHDGVKVVLKELYDRPDIDTLVLDELAVYRNANERSKIMQKFAQPKTWVWGLTGAPTPNEPTDVWGQARIITPGAVPKFFGRFREHLMYKINQFKWAPRADATEKAFAVLKPAVRYTLEDVRELPAFISRRIDVDMGPKQRLVYDQIKQSCFAMVGTETITAVNAGAALNKLLQISLGYVYSTTKGIVQLDNNDRTDALLDILDAAEGKVMVFTAFKHALAGLHASVTSAGHDATVVSGDTPAKARDLIFNAFQNTPQYRVLLAHPQCLAHGLTLTAADTIVWFGPITSLEIYDQANARIRRVGQTRKQQFIHLQATPTEKKIYSLLINKQDVQSQLLDMFRD
jgi:SNF2 family DNA or RNA helicase